MEEKLLKIINHYGVMHQLEYFQSEVWELNEAILEYENTYFEPYTDYSIEPARRVSEEEQKEDLKKHIAEEIADCYVMLNQFKEYYLFDFEIVKEIIYFEKEPLKYLKMFQKDIHRLNLAIHKVEMLKKNYKIYDELGMYDIRNKLQYVFYSLRQFQLFYKISDEQIKEIMNQKIDRQLNRIKDEK